MEHEADHFSRGREEDTRRRVDQNIEAQFAEMERETFRSLDV